jgi:hypothetical protein
MPLLGPVYVPFMPLVQNPKWIQAMKNQFNTAVIKPWPLSVGDEPTEGRQPGQLEVNVIFTDPQATAVALRTAASFARNLGACIRVRAAISVPYGLPLDEPPVSLPFTESLLCDLVCRLEQSDLEPTIHLYLCRDQVETLLQVLTPNSLVVIGGPKHWWPTTECRIAEDLRSTGHRVVLIGLKRGTKSDLR